MAVKKKKMSKKGRILLTVILSVLAVALVCGAVLLGMIMNKYAKIEDHQNDLQSMFNEGQQNVPSGTDPNELDPNTDVVPAFNELYNRNSDILGWIKIDGTKLSSVVVKGTDNVFYLDHDFDKKQTVLGVPFADFRSTLSPGLESTNVTVYGHASRDGSYFAPVKQYRTVEYYKEHPLIEFDTIYGKRQYKIIGAFIARVKNSEADDPEDFNYHDYVDMDEATFNTFVEEVGKRSYFDTGVDVRFGDQLLTLSTCDDTIDSSLTTPYRMVLIGRLVREGEDASVDTSKAAANTDMIMPSAWSAKNGGKANPYS